MNVERVQHTLGCPACGTRLTAVADRCPNCNDILQEESVPIHRGDPIADALADPELPVCSGCGKRLSPYLAKCPYCGLFTHSHSHSHDAATQALRTMMPLLILGGLGLGMVALFSWLVFVE